MGPRLRGDDGKNEWLSGFWMIAGYSIRDINRHACGKGRVALLEGRTQPNFLGALHECRHFRSLIGNGIERGGNVLQGGPAH